MTNLPAREPTKLAEPECEMVPMGASVTFLLKAKPATRGARLEEHWLPPVRATMFWQKGGKKHLHPRAPCLEPGTKEKQHLSCWH